MNTQTQTALNMAIEALEGAEIVLGIMGNQEKKVDVYSEAINACKEALNSQEQEPSFFGWYDNHDIHDTKQSDESIALYTHPAPIQEQEPVAWMDSEGRFKKDFKTEIVRSLAAVNKEIPLYTHPAPAWQGLSDDEMLEIAKKARLLTGWPNSRNDYVNFARAIEQALKERNT